MADNKTNLLRHVWNYPGVYRKQIASQLNLRLNLVTDIVKELIDDGWVCEEEGHSTGVGRNPISLYINRKKKASIVFTYNSAVYEAAVVGPDGEVRDITKKTLNPITPAKILDECAACIKEFTSKSAYEIIGIGWADPGMVDFLKGTVVRSSTLPGEINIHYAEKLANKTNLSVLLEDQTRSRAVGEYLTRNKWRQQSKTMLYLEYSDTLGMTIISKDGIWRGGGFAGEIGHVVFKNANLHCTCGARGCLESIIKPEAVIKKAEMLLEKTPGSILAAKKDFVLQDIFQAYFVGDRLAKSIIYDIVEPISDSIASIVSAIHPDFLVVGAPVQEIAKVLTIELQKQVVSKVLPELSNSIEFLSGGNFENSLLRGMGLMVFDEYIMKDGNSFIKSVSLKKTV